MPFLEGENYIHNFTFEGDSLPSIIGYPLAYAPEEVAIAAAEDLKDYLKREGAKLHDFYRDQDMLDGGGKMMGVLVVKAPDDKLGYLAGFSGKLRGKTQVPGFVPPIFDLLSIDNFFLEEEAVISAVNEEHEALQEKLEPMEKAFAKLKIEKERDLQEIRDQMKRNKVDRRAQRAAGANEKALDRLSILDKNAYRKKRQDWEDKLIEPEENIRILKENIKQLELKRAKLSNQLQLKMFDAYKIMNGRGEGHTIAALFNESKGVLPPAGAGDCAAPKLFQYAFNNGLEPIAMAEFWWGAAAIGEVRKEGFYYTACKSKCEPILNFMLQGLNVAPNPNEQVEDIPEIGICYEDEHIVAINKPSGVLSVPGKSKQLSITDWAKERYSEYDELFLAHRLDRDTSGILLIAKSKEVYIDIQKQFSSRTIRKEYTAILDTDVNADGGIISLPLRTDFDDRPRQMVCYEYGKEAETEFKVVDRNEGKTRILFKPHTGRTHQLRVHASHPMGLNASIKGDTLYGVASDRLYLHASKLEFKHPISGEEICIACPAEF